METVVKTNQKRVVAFVGLVAILSFGVIVFLAEVIIYSVILFSYAQDSDPGRYIWTIVLANVWMFSCSAALITVILSQCADIVRWMVPDLIKSGNQAVARFRTKYKQFSDRIDAIDIAAMIRARRRQ